VFLDAEAGEAFDRKSVSFQDLPQLMQQLTLTVSAASQIPVTVLMGQAPAGLQATGEGDFRNWHATLRAERDRSYGPKLQRVTSYALGQPIEVGFDPLWQPTEPEEADIRAKQLAGDRAAWEMNVVSSQEIRDSRGRDGSLGLQIEPGSKAPATGIGDTVTGS
jgi:hypothetical protein